MADNKTVISFLASNFVLIYSTFWAFEPPHGKTNNLHRRKQRRRSGYTAKLISAFVFATRIVQFLYFLNPKFPVIFCACTGWFVSDLFENLIVGFPTRRLICHNQPGLTTLYSNISFHSTHYENTPMLYTYFSKVVKKENFQ